KIAPPVGGVLTRLFADVPGPTGSTWSPRPSSATGTSASTTAEPAQTGVLRPPTTQANDEARQIRDEHPWREGRATGSSSSPDDRHRDGLGNSSGQLGR